MVFYDTVKVYKLYTIALNFFREVLETRTPDIVRLSRILLQNVPAREGAVLHDQARLRVGCEINVFVSYGQVLHL